MQYNWKYTGTFLFKKKAEGFLMAISYTLSIIRFKRKKWVEKESPEEPICHEKVAEESITFGDFDTLVIYWLIKVTS